MRSMASRCRSRGFRRSWACAWVRWNRCSETPSPFPVLMRRFIWLLFLPAGLAAQRPAVSPVLPRLLARRPDTTVSVWLFARPTASLDSVSARVAVAGGNARVRVVSRWLHAVSADLPATALRQLLQDRDLRRIQPLGRFKVRPPSPVLRSITAPTQAPGDTCGVTPGDDPVLGP